MILQYFLPALILMLALIATSWYINSLVALIVAHVYRANDKPFNANAKAASPWLAIFHWVTFFIITRAWS